MSDNVFIATGGLEKAIGKTIVHAGLNKHIERKDGITSAANIRIEDGTVVVRTSEYSVEHLTFFLQFDDESELHISDGAQYCCEHRYLTCDDDCSVLVGGKLLNVELATIKEINVPEDHDYHDIGIVKVESDKGHIVLCTHNEHNGYYGGFDLVTTYFERKEIDKGNSV